MIGVASKVASLLKVGSIRTMATKPKKRKRKIRVKTGAKVVKKDSVRNDTLPRVQGRPPADVAPTFRVKIRKKR